jgi:mannose-1-phosphate guanylyltransferase
LNANQSTFIKKGEVHRIENKSKKDLIMIEVQTGEYLEEDDIKRFQDLYKR